MVFGNMGETSATDVAFTRSPSVGAHELYGEFLGDAHGEDVVAGIRTPQNITVAARIAAGSHRPSPEIAGGVQELRRDDAIAGTPLPRHAGRGVHVQRGKPWTLQTRNGKRTTKAALEIAISVAGGKLITREAAALPRDGAFQSLNTARSHIQAVRGHAVAAQGLRLCGRLVLD